MLLPYLGVGTLSIWEVEAGGAESSATSYTVRLSCTVS